MNVVHDGTSLNYSLTTQNTTQDLRLFKQQAIRNVKAKLLDAITYVKDFYLQYIQLRLLRVRMQTTRWIFMTVGVVEWLSDMLNKLHTN